MPRSITAPQIQATAGELDPMLMARSDLPFYAAGWRRADNVICLAHGASPRRGGSRWAGLLRPDTSKLTAFRFAPGDAYWLGWGEKKLRFYRTDRTPVLNGGGTPLELDTPYTAAQATALRWQPSADVIYFAHPDVPLQKLSRPALDSFTIAPHALKDGPYYAMNADTANTVSLPAGGVGDIAVSFAKDTLDPSNDVGRMFRVKKGSNPDLDGWAWGVFKTVSDTKNGVVTFDANGPVSGADTLSEWRLGLYSKKTGYPCALTIHQQRLFLASNCANTFPRVDSTRTGDFADMRPGVIDDEGIQDVVDGDEVPVLRDLKANRSLFAFSTGGVHQIDTSNTSVALTPTNENVTLIEPAGAGDVRVIRARRAILFPDFMGESIGELAYDLRYNGAVYREQSVRSAHLFHDFPIVDFEWADKPWGQCIAPRIDGSFVLGTYNPDQETDALSPHALGGDAKVLSVATVPTSNGNEIGLLVDRGGVRSLEVLARLLRNSEDEWIAVNVDAAVTKFDPPDATLTLISTLAGVQTWQADANVFDTVNDKGKVLRFRQYLGRDRKNNLHTWKTLSGTIASVPAANQVTIKLDGDAPSLPSPMAAGTWYRSFTVMDGLGHLEGQQALVWAEGRTLGPFTVSMGKITLPHPVCCATAGLGYRSAWQSMPPAPATAKGSAVGRPTQQIADRVRVLRAADLRQLDWKGDAKALVPVETGAKPTDAPRPLFTGDLKLASDNVTEAPVAPVLVCDGAGPCTVLASVPTVAIGETG